MRSIVRLVYILAILIFIDLTATLFWLSHDLATEANPIMDWFLQLSPLLFVIAKLGLSAIGIWILYFLRKRFTKIIFQILLGLNLVYISIFVYHLWGVLFLLISTN
tara:strand:- start:5316 stop:5633 length:318 start_codon:yes stop_codon:yes gene_type:complete